MKSIIFLILQVAFLSAYKLEPNFNEADDVAFPESTVQDLIRSLSKDMSVQDQELFQHFGEGYAGILKEKFESSKVSLMTEDDETTTAKNHFHKKELSKTRVLSTVVETGEHTFITIDQKSKLEGNATSVDSSQQSNVVGNFDWELKSIVNFDKQGASVINSTASANSTYTQDTAKTLDDDSLQFKSSLVIDSDIVAENGLTHLHLQTKVDSVAEIFNGPFSTYLTKFESDWDVSNGTRIGKIIGQIVTKLIHSNHADHPQILKSSISGSILARNNQSDGIQSFTVEVVSSILNSNDGNNIRVRNVKLGKVKGIAEVGFAGGKQIEMRVLSNTIFASIETSKISVVSKNITSMDTVKSLTKKLIQDSNIKFNDLFTNFGIYNIM